MKYFLILIFILKLANAQDLPFIESPSILSEGTERKLNKEQISKILPWAKNSKVFLQDLLIETKSMPFRFRIDRLRDGVKNVVLNSAPHEGELLLRYVLNRGEAILNIIEDQTIADTVGIDDLKVRVLVQSIELAIEYYSYDIEYLNAADQEKFETPFAKFGVHYAHFLMELNKSTIDASAQYELALAALEFLQWDLYRDFANKTYAGIIYKINNALKTYPRDGERTDEEYLVYIRTLKKLYRDLSLDDLKIVGPKKIVYNNNNSSFNVEKIGETEINGYRKMLAATSWATRKSAIEHLKNVQGEEVTSLIIESLGDYYTEVVDTAVLALKNRTLTNPNCTVMASTFRKSKNWLGRSKIVKLAGPSYEIACRQLIARAMADIYTEVSSVAYGEIIKKDLVELYQVSIICSEVLNSTNWKNRQFGARALSLAKANKEAAQSAYKCLVDKFPIEKYSEVSSAMSGSMNTLNGVLNRQN